MNRCEHPTHCVRPTGVRCSRPPHTPTQPSTRESWIGLDGSGRIRETVGGSTFPTPRDRRAWERAGRPDLDTGETSDNTYGRGELSWRDLSKFPADAEKLLQVLEKRELVGGDAADW